MITGTSENAICEKCVTVISVPKPIAVIYDLSGAVQLVLLGPICNF